MTTKVLRKSKPGIKSEKVKKFVKKLDQTQLLGTIDFFVRCKLNI